MKKYLLLILVCVFALQLFGCNHTQTPVTSFPCEFDFSAYIKTIPLLPDTTLEDFLSTYTYNGTSIADIVKVLLNADGANSHLTRYRGTVDEKNFEFIIESYETSDRKYNNLRKTFLTEVLLDGFELPCGITFGESISDVLQKLGIRFDPEKDFKVKKRDNGAMTLYRNDQFCIQFIDCELSSAEFYPGYVLQYEEYSPSTQAVTGRETTVTRTVRLSFDEQSELDHFEISVKECWEINQD